MDNQLFELEETMINYNKVKDLVIGQLITEGLLSEEVGKEFIVRNQVLVYKGTWFSRWFDKNIKGESKEIYRMRLIQMD